MTLRDEIDRSLRSGESATDVADRLSVGDPDEREQLVEAVRFFAVDADLDLADRCSDLLVETSGLDTPADLGVALGNDLSLAFEPSADADDLDEVPVGEAFSLEVDESAGASAFESAEASSIEPTDADPFALEIDEPGVDTGEDASIDELDPGDVGGLDLLD